MAVYDPDVLVSIIVPVYNPGSRLTDCVASILAQDHSSIELILVDDGSTDGSAETCDRIAAADPRVMVVHQSNKGIAAAQNAGLDVASGQYITFCDNDDLMSAHLVSRLLSIAQENDADMSCCRWLSSGESTAIAALESLDRQTPGRVDVFDHPGYWYQSVFSLAMRRLRRTELRYFSEANWGKLYRASLFHGVRFPEGTYAQDVAIAMDLYMKMGRVASCEDRLYVWVQHPSSVSHRERGTSYFHDIVRAHGRCFDLAIASGVTPARAYGGMLTLDLERRSRRSDADDAMYRADVDFVRRRLHRLTKGQRLRCWLLHRLRRLEVLVYRATVHRRR